MIASSAFEATLVERLPHALNDVAVDELLANRTPFAELRVVVGRAVVQTFVDKVAHVGQWSTAC